MEQDFEKLLDNLNKTFEPLSKQIESKLNLLNDCIGESTEYQFKKLTKDDIES